MKQYIVDAFTDHVFAGNPAAVCMLGQWLPDALMQEIAVENNLSETAFAVKGQEGYGLRWFAPGGEVGLCGHGTLATAYVVSHFVEPGAERMRFSTKGGLLEVVRKGELFEMDFPSFPLFPIAVTEAMCQAVGVRPLEAYRGEDLVCVLETEEQVREVVPRQELIRQLDGLCLHITARGREADCVTRTFAPKCHVPEDPVCGRAHCHVIPLWAQKTGKTTWKAYQASPRGGFLFCRYEGERTILGGQAVLYAESEIGGWD